MRINQLIAKFVDILDILDKQGIHIPGLIMSSPGAGKTSTLELLTKLKDYNLVSLIASQYSSDDILGIQSVKQSVNGKDELRKLTPSWYNNLIKISENGKRTILFIDEITTCDEFIQSPLLNLIFNRSLGEYDLPDNCFIVAAGNYSEELNGAFSVTPPLINRFLLLNLSDADYSMTEVLKNVFRLLKESEYEDFLDLKPSENPKYNFEKFKDWVEKSISFTPSTITNNREEGLLGFCSIRSVTYCMDFAREYMKRFNDDDWIRIVGDTLGKYKSGDDWLPLRMKISDNKTKFIEVTKKQSVEDFITVLNEYINDVRSHEYDGKYYNVELLQKLQGLMEDPDRLTSSETRALSKAAKDNPDLEILNTLYKKFLESLKSSPLNFD